MVSTRETLDSKTNSTKVTAWKIHTMPIVTVSQSQNGYLDVRQSGIGNEIEDISNDKASVYQGGMLLYQMGSLVHSVKLIQWQQVLVKKSPVLLQHPLWGQVRRVAHAWMTQTPQWILRKTKWGRGSQGYWSAHAQFWLVSGEPTGRCLGTLNHQLSASKLSGAYMPVESM